MISDRLLKYVPKISEFKKKKLITVFISKMPFFCSQEGVKGHDGGVWANRQLFLTYCLQIGAISNELQRKCRFCPMDSSAVAGPALLIAICRENGQRCVN